MRVVGHGGHGRAHGDGRGAGEQAYHEGGKGRPVPPSRFDLVLKTSASIVRHHDEQYHNTNIAPIDGERS